MKLYQVILYHLLKVKKPISKEKPLEALIKGDTIYVVDIPWILLDHKELLRDDRPQYLLPKHCVMKPKILSTTKYMDVSTNTVKNMRIRYENVKNNFFSLEKIIEINPYMTTRTQKPNLPYMNTIIFSTNIKDANKELIKLFKKIKKDAEILIRQNKNKKTIIINNAKHFLKLIKLISLQLKMT